MKTNIFKRGVSVFMAMLMCLSAFVGISTTTAHAKGTESEVYMIAFPRDGDENYSGEWGHGNLNYMNGWSSGTSNVTLVRTMAIYDRTICYCIEPGVHLSIGDKLTEWGENFWDNYPSDYNSTIAPDDIKLLIGRIMQYGYTGSITSSWRSQDESGDTLAYAVATQLLIWETVVGERDADFNKVITGGYDAILDQISDAHPLRSQILSHYNSIAASVQTHSKLPSFFARSTGKAQSTELEWDGTKYTVTLTDTNNVLSNYSFSSNQAGVRFSVSGNKLTITADTAPSGTMTITASKNAQRRGIITWTDEEYGPDSTLQDVVTYAESVSDPIVGYLNINGSYGSAKIVKTSEDGKVDGLNFRIQGNGVDKTVTTANGGQIQIDNLTPGVYTVTEQNYDKYEPQESRKVTVIAGQTATVTFNNTLRRGDLTITKIAEDGLEQGMKFHLYGTSLSGLAVDEYAVVGADGKAHFQDVLIGSGYTLEEVGTPDRYIVPDKQTADIEWNKVTNKSFENDLKRGDLTVTKTAEDGLEQGVRFHLYGTSYSGLPVDEYATVGADGKAYFKDILIGTGYILEEYGIPDRYIVPDNQKVDIEWNKITNKSFENDLKRGDLIVTKIAEDGLAQGMRFHLYGTSYSGLPVDEYATVGSDGKAYFKNILIGTGYTLEEVGTPDRYVVPEDQTVEIEWNIVTKKTVENSLQKWNLTVTKRDSENGTAQGDASLAGAVYGIYKGDELIDRYTTDSRGQFTTKYYSCGDDWSLREITPSEGYLLDETIHHIGAESKNYTVEYNAISDTVYETVKKGNIAIIKHTDNGETQLETPEVGAEFAVYLKSAGSYNAAKETERDYLVCDENGFAETKMLPYGIFTVHQVKGWDGREFLPDFDVYIAEDGHTYRYIANNANFESYIKVVKVDAETGKAIPYAGAGFRLYRPDGSLITQTFTYPTPTTIDIFYTNDKGYLITPESLEYGTGYYLVEVSAPYGYVLNTDPVYFDVTADNATEENAVTIVKVVKENMPQKGIIKISKTGEVFASVVESDGVYQPVYTVQGLPGAVYEIIAAEDIYTLDGTLRYAKGTVVDTITTDKTGNAQSKPLYLGKFEVKEITAPHGCVLNEEIRTVELTYAGQEIEITETAASFYNERQKAAVSLDKVMEQNDKFGIGMNGEITAVTFGLYAAEDLITVDGSVIPADSLLEIVSVDENGHVVFATDLPIGSFYLKEIATDSHYILSDTKYPVVFEYAGQEVAIVNVTVNDGKALNNDLIYGTVKGLKIDRETEETIAGAVFGLFRSDETEFTEETAILTAISGEDGVFVFENVPYGDWIIVELAPAEGFLPNTEIYRVNVTTDEEIIKITVVNDRIPEIGTTATTEDEKQTHPGEIVTIDDVVEYKHLIPGKEYTIKGILMDKATGQPFLVNGEQIVSEVTFVPENQSGEVVVTFVFDGTGITENTDLVVFESLYKDGIELTVHADIEDDGQTVTVLVPEIGTTATVDGEKEVNGTEVVTLEDVVAYKNLIPGKEYTVKGVLMDKTTGEPLLLNGEEIRSEVTFIPETPSGEVVVTFTFDSKLIKADTGIVVFETLYYGELEVTVHADIEDEGQTVTVHVPEIGTQATANGEKEVEAKGKVTIEDVISYKNLTPGKEYTIKGVLMNKVTGQPFLVNGKELHSEATFTPETADGEVNVYFIFDADGITTETEIVVFETLYRDGVEIAVHADIEDDGQTVKLLPPPSEPPKTGDESNIGLWITLLWISAAGLIATGIMGIKRRKKEDAE